MGSNPTPSATNMSMTSSPLSSYYIWTIGCQMNKAESERLGSYHEGLGYQAAATADRPIPAAD